MAIDTEKKRRRATGVGRTPGTSIPKPDGTIDARDRAQLAGVYLPEGTIIGYAGRAPMATGNAHISSLMASEGYGTAPMTLNGYGISAMTLNTVYGDSPMYTEGYGISDMEEEGFV